MPATSNFLFDLQNFPLSSWNFTQNCTASAHFLQSFYENGDAGSTITIRFLLDSLPRGINSSIPYPDLESALFSWFRSTKIPQQVLENAALSCLTELCPLLRWEGEPDAAGIGVCDIT